MEESRTPGARRFSPLRLHIKPNTTGRITLRVCDLLEYKGQRRQEGDQEIDKWTLNEGNRGLRTRWGSWEACIRLGAGRVGPALLWTPLYVQRASRTFGPHDAGSERGMGNG